MPLITVSQLSAGYGTRCVAHGISFTVEPADYLCIVGENGSGKSTLMRTLLGLQPPLSGEVELGGAGRRGIGYLPQRTDVQRDFPVSVREVVLMGFQGSMRHHPFLSRAERARAARVMERVGVSRLARRGFGELSGGQQQRVLLARALCAADRLLLLDEPVTGLDPDAAASLYALLDSLNRDDGLAIVMISHDVDQALAHARQVLAMGSPPFVGTPAQYVARQRLAKEAIL